jgi:hypothetical protein
VDQPADLLPTTSVRYRTTLARLSTIALHSASAVRRSAAVAWWFGTDALPWLAARLAAALPRPSAATVRRLGSATILAVAIIAVSVAPAYAARLARADLWNLARFFDGPQPDVSSDGLVLVLASIVVLAVVSAHSGRHHDHW